LPQRNFLFESVISAVVEGQDVGAGCSAIALHGDEQNEMMNRCGEKVITLLPHE
jgi:hypothetical protein